ncbi:glycoside hydrolase [Pararhodonellum marinum]|uniref:hypothetical protein n=1 Tax=Pararhodonellum marinum TaxID=2755358 RepID=UPI00188F8226|nr:hypothetical protein [Pararhodonellum marinum]
MTFDLKKSTLNVLLACGIICSCGGEENGPNAPNGNGNLETVPVNITLDQSTTFQEIDGFGFFGARDVWWTGNRENLYSDTWADLVIRDLGITIWRNEYYPPATATQGQDADWEKQLPVVRGLRDKANQHQVDLKFIFTVWSPPADFKCREANNERFPGEPHPEGTKQGGTLDPNKYEAFGNWLGDGIQLYANEGIEVYAISPQNEPLFRQPFNSCYYRPAWYNQMLVNSIPIVKARFPEVKVFGSENMLAIEAGDDGQFFYHEALKNDPEAAAMIDIQAIHGYVDGVVPSSTSQMVRLWNDFQQKYVTAMPDPVWMTETSSYYEDWTTTDNRSGALDLGLAIHSALSDGNASAWVWWQGAQTDGMSEFNLMRGEERGKRYHVSKHFYRYIRPGAKRIQLELEQEDSDLFASAFVHESRDIYTIVLINAGSDLLEVNLQGSGLPSSFESFASSATLNCEKGEDINSGKVLISPKSIITLVSGDVYE